MRIRETTRRRYGGGGEKLALHGLPERSPALLNALQLLVLKEREALHLRVVESTSHEPFLSLPLFLSPSLIS